MADLSQANIDKLLAARKAFDDCRQAKQEAHNVQFSDLQSLKAVVLQLPDSKPGITEFDIQTTLSMSLDLAISTRDRALSELGFNSIEGLRQFNEEMCLSIIRQERTIIGECDKCAGYEKEAPCIAMFGKDACFHGPTLDKELQYREMLKRARRNRPAVDKAARDAVSDKQVFIRDDGKPITYDKARGVTQLNCPEGHGFTVKHSMLRDEVPFDLNWTM